MLHLSKQKLFDEYNFIFIKKMINNDDKMQNSLVNFCVKFERH